MATLIVIFQHCGVKDFPNSYFSNIAYRPCLSPNLITSIASLPNSISGPLLLQYIVFHGPIIIAMFSTIEFRPKCSSHGHYCCSVPKIKGDCSSLKRVHLRYNIIQLLLLARIARNDFLWWGLAFLSFAQSIQGVARFLLATRGLCSGLHSYVLLLAPYLRTQRSSLDVVVTLSLQRLPWSWFVVAKSASLFPLFFAP